jgi:hypothetical protein
MAAGDPTGGDLASGTTAGNGLPQAPAEPQDTKITFGAGTALTSGVVYAIVIRSAGVGFSNACLCQMKSPGDYAGGQRFLSSNSGSSWSGDAEDCWFKTYTSAGFNVLRDSYNPVWAGASSISYDTQWTAQTFTATSSYTITAVNLKLGRLSGASPETITISIRATEGAPTKANTPLPTNANTSVTLDQATIAWTDGGGADTYNVYYGTTSGSLSLVSSAQAGTSFTVTGITDGAPYSYLSTRYWRVDSTNVVGTTTGDEWSFVTIRFTPVGVNYFYPTTGRYYRLLIQDDGTYGDPPGVGVENTDYVYLAAGYEANFVSTNRKLVAAAENRIWYEDI